MAENYSTLGATTVAVGGYTAASGVLNVASTTGSPAFPSPNFRVVIQDQTTLAYKAVLKVTAVNSGTQFAVTADAVGIDNNAAAGDFVYAVLTAEGLTAILGAISSGVTRSGCYLVDGGNTYHPQYLNSPVTIPSAGSFSWVNQGSSTEVAQTGGALLLTIPAASTTNLRCRTKSISSTTVLKALIGGTGTPINYTAWGIFVREASSGKIASFHVRTQDGSGNGMFMEVITWTNATTFASTLSSRRCGLAANCAIWLKFDFTGGVNYDFSYSTIDETNFAIFLRSTSGGIGFTPDEWGYFCATENNSLSQYAILYSFEES